MYSQARNWHASRQVWKPVFACRVTQGGVTRAASEAGVCRDRHNADGPDDAEACGPGLGTWGQMRHYRPGPNKKSRHFPVDSRTESCDTARVSYFLSCTLRLWWSFESWGQYTEFWACERFPSYEESGAHSLMVILASSSAEITPYWRLSASAGSCQDTVGRVRERREEGGGAERGCF